MLSRRLTLPFVGAFAALASAAPAHALTADVSGPTLRVTAGAFEANRIVVALSGGSYVVRDNGAVVGTFSTSGINGLRVDAGDLDDTITIQPEVPVGATLIDGAGDDTVTGGARKDTFVGSPGADTLIGGAGDDVFGDAGGAGGDTLDGGAGWDVADYSTRATPLHVTLDGVGGDGAEGEGDDVRPTVEEVVGGAEADRLVGSDAANTLKGGGGDDSFDGRGGADRYEGGSGQDAADYRGRTGRVVVSADGTANDGAPGEGDNVGGDVDDLYGGSGDDELTGNSWWSTLDGGAGNDVVRGGGGDDTVVGGTGNDTLDGGDGADLLAGGDGDDTVGGANGDDVLDGGWGADRLVGGAGLDVVDYRTRVGAITVDLASGTTGEPGEGDRLDGVDGAWTGAGDDRLRGDDEDNRFDGGAGDDVLDGRGGADRLAGGEGWDRVDYTSRRGGVNVSLNDGADDGGGSERDDVRRDVEEVAGGSGADKLAGDDDANVLIGGSGDDTLNGNGGGDTLDGGDGGDVLDGGRENDDLRGGDDEDKLSGGDGEDRLDGGASNDQLSGNGGHDALEGGAGHDQLGGGDGNDALSGSSGNDKLNGDNGIDTLDGAGGADQLEGGRDDDRLSGGDEADKLGGGDGHDGLDGGSGDDQLGGGSGNDGLAGGAGSDKLYGDDGVDTLDGAGGGDQLDGGRDDDLLRGGDDADKLAGGDGNDTLDGAVGNDTLNGGNGNDVVRAGDGDDKAYGDNGDDRIDGGPGRDELGGGGDADVLVGGAGPDVVKGDGGEDTVDYALRTAPLRITNDGKADDGEKGEGDNVDGSVDHAIGGAGNDLIRFASDWPHRLYGEGGDDTLDGGPKADLLMGGVGNDQLIGRGGRDTFDAGAGNDKLSGADGLKETLNCGTGKKDSAVRDRSDKGVGCEKLRVGKVSSNTSATTAPEDADVVPIATTKTGRLKGTKRVYKGGGLVAIPGFAGERIDKRLLKDLAYLKAKYKIHITDGYAPTGHADGGEHPRGLAIDVVPGAGGSWAKIDQLAKWAEPRQGRPRAPFRWVGYNGDAGHGRGDHLHLSWNHASVKRGRTAKWVDTLAFKGGKATVRRVRNLIPFASRSNARLGGKLSVKTGVRALPRCRGPQQLVGTWKAAGRAFGIRWTVLAAITQVESGHGCNMGPSSAGALGWTQFMPATWKTWGMDADGDGKASPHNSADAIFSSARYLRATGAPRSYRKALFAYNHAEWYVNKVLAVEKQFRR